MKSKYIVYALGLCFMFVSFLGFSVWILPYNLYKSNTENELYYNITFNSFIKMHNDFILLCQDKPDSDVLPISYTQWLQHGFESEHLSNYNICLSISGCEDTYYMLSFIDYWKYRGWLSNEAKKYAKSGKCLGTIK